MVFYHTTVTMLIPSQISIQIPIPVLFSTIGLLSANRNEKIFHLSSTVSTIKAITGPIGKAAVNIVTYAKVIKPFINKHFLKKKWILTSE